MGNTDSSMELYREGEMEESLKDTLGEGDVSVWEVFKSGFDGIVHTIIRPDRRTYGADDLGPQKFDLRAGNDFEKFIVSSFASTATETDERVKRSDFILKNSRHMEIMTSVWTLDGNTKARPMLVFVHGNFNGSRLDALPLVLLALRQGFDVCAFDCCGSGISSGTYVSLGWFEKDDISAVLAGLKARYTETISGFVLWGHSMGATASILYLARAGTARDIKYLVLDSPYRNARQVTDGLVNEAKNEGVSAPKWVVAAGHKMIKKSVQLQAGFDLDLVETSKASKQCNLPAILIRRGNDRFVSENDLKLMKKAYAGDCKILDVPSIDALQELPSATMVQILQSVRQSM